MSLETVICTNIKRLDEPSLYDNLYCANGSTEKICTNQMYKSDADDSIFKSRYLVALFEFFSLFYINACRLATSISVVAMVNKSAVSSHSFYNNSVISCPVDTSDEMDYSLPETDGEFDWSPAIQGYILGSGFLGYVITLMPGGILAEIYGAKIVILTGLILSTAGHLLSPLAASSGSDLMIAAQLLRGIGQGFIPAAQSVLSTNWFPKSERGFLNSFIMTGYAFGSLVSGFSSGTMCSSPLIGGWPSVYYIYGILGLILCFCFYIFVFESPQCHPRIRDAELAFILKEQESDLSLKRPPTPWKSILTSVPVYAVTFGLFGNVWVGSHILAVQPIYLGTILHLSIQENGIFTSIPFAIQVIFSYISSTVCKLLNIGVDKARKGNNLLACLGYSLCILGIYYGGCQKTLSTVFSVAAMSFIGFSFNGCMIAPLDMSPNFAGTVMGFTFSIGSLSSFIFPVLVGVITNEKQTIEEWNKIFFLSIGIIMSSGIIFSIFGSAEVQPWNNHTIECAVKTQPNKTKEEDKQNEKNLEFPINAVLHL